MDERAEREVLRELAMRLATLEDNVAFLEVWCEEQQDVLDRVGGAVSFSDFEEHDDQDSPPRTRLYVVDSHEPDVPEENEHQVKVRQLRARLHRLRDGLGPDAVAGTWD